jgi:hypothetical protein
MEKMLKRGILLAAIGLGASFALTAQAEDSSVWKKWMKDNVVPAKSAGDFAKLELVLGKIKKANPDQKAFPKWDEISDKGIAAAKAKDKEAVNKSCTDCHNEYRKLFKEKYRDSKPPE